MLQSPVKKEHVLGLEDAASGQSPALHNHRVNSSFGAETRSFPGCGAWARLPTQRSRSWKSFLWSLLSRPIFSRVCLAHGVPPCPIRVLPALLHSCHTSVMVLNPVSSPFVFHWTLLMGTFGLRALHLLARSLVELRCGLRPFLPSPPCFSLSISGVRHAGEEGSPHTSCSCPFVLTVPPLNSPACPTPSRHLLLKGPA